MYVVCKYLADICLFWMWCTIQFDGSFYTKVQIILEVISATFSIAIIEYREWYFEGTRSKQINQFINLQGKLGLSFWIQLVLERIVFHFVQTKYHLYAHLKRANYHAFKARK